MNEEKLKAILIEALAALEVGETVEQILSRYPAERDQLQPMLRAAVRLNAYGQETLGARPLHQFQARQAFLTRAAAHAAAHTPAARTPAPHTRRASWLIRPLMAFLTIVILAIAVSGGVLGASAASLPGDPLYGVKRSVENIQLSLAFNPAQRANLEETYGQRRTEEVKAVQAAKRSTGVEFTGAVEAIGAAAWAIDGLVAQVTENTVLNGNPQMGDWVRVTGRTVPDGKIVADRIEVEESDLAGTVEAMGAPRWTIGGKGVLVTRDTRITGTARLGAQVKLRVRRFPDGTLLALKIEFDDTDLTVPGLPTATLRPGATRTPLPTTRAEPSATPKPIKTSEPTETSRPRPTEPDESSRTPEATRTPRPSETDEPGRTPEPTEIREPSRTPERTRLPEPTRTPEPRHTPEPTETRRPTQAPEPTKTREPTETPKP